MSAKLVPTFVYRGSREVRAADHYGRNLGFLDQDVLKVVTLKLLSPVKAKSTFRRNVSPPSSGSMKQETDKMHAVSNILVSLRAAISHNMQ
jgi:hypothetical protein